MGKTYKFNRDEYGNKRRKDIRRGSRETELEKEFEAVRKWQEDKRG